MLRPVEGEESSRSWKTTMPRKRIRWRLSFVGILLSQLCPIATESSAEPLDQLTDFTGRTSVIVTLKGRDNFNSEYLYDVSVKNFSADTFIQILAVKVISSFE